MFGSLCDRSFSIAMQKTSAQYCDPFISNAGVVNPRFVGVAPYIGSLNTLLFLVAQPFLHEQNEQNEQNVNFTT